jgi:hypothetical protein
MKPRKTKSLCERFWQKVAIADGCWEWLGAKNRRGYGGIGLGRAAAGRAYAHRVAWELESGRPIPEGMHVLHRCDNPSCVRASHLFLGSATDNMQDCVSKGRISRGTRRKIAKLDEISVHAARAYAQMGWTYLAIGNLLGVSEGAVGDVVRRKTWAHVA